MQSSRSCMVYNLRVPVTTWCGCGYIIDTLLQAGEYQSDYPYPPCPSQPWIEHLCYVYVPCKSKKIIVFFPQ